MTATDERAVSAFREECSRELDATTLFARASSRLRSLVPFDGSCWFATDPATVLATCPVRVENVDATHCTTYWDREHRVEDALLYRDLARSATGIDTLYHATDGTPGRSARYREFLSPQGYGDEIRAAVRVGESTWGVLDLFRSHDREAFTSREVAAVAGVLPALAQALRAAAGAGRAGAGDASGADGPGTALLTGDGDVLSLDEPTELLFAELAGPSWSAMPLAMSPVAAVAARAVAVSQGRDRGPASLRVRAISGRWLILHASSLTGRDGTSGPVALTIQPARSSQIAPIIVAAYGLTPREQEITRGVARGLSNPEIAAELHLSAFTVRDHLKTVFAKIGVAGRGELVAALFAEHHAPSMWAPGAAVEHVEVTT